MLKRIYSSSIFNSWFSSFILLFSSLVAIPIVITKLSAEEINVWFLYASITALSQSILFGFNVTFSRFIAFSFSGVAISEYRNIRFKKELKYSENINVEEFTQIYLLMKRVYIFLASIYFLIVFLLFLIFLNGPIESLKDTSDGWIAGAIVLISTTTVLYFGYNQNFMYGIQKVALLNRIQGVVHLVGLLLILLVLFTIPSLVSIVFVYKFVSVLSVLIVRHYAKKEYLSLCGGIKRKFVYGKELFKPVWESTWKSGMTSILANFIRHLSVLIVSQLFPPATSAMFLFTKRLFDILENFTTVTFHSKVPFLTTLRGRGDTKGFTSSLIRIQYISYGVFFLGYILLIVLGDSTLVIIKSNVQLCDVSIIILFSFASFLSRWAAFTAMVSNISNHVVDYKLFVVITFVYFTVIFVLYKNVGIHVFPLATVLGFIIGSPILMKHVYSTFYSTFFNYEKKVMIPLALLLLFINLVYYING